MATSEDAPPRKKPTRLAIGVEGGFDGGVAPVELEENLELLVLPEMAAIPLPCPNLPPNVSTEAPPLRAWPRLSRLTAVIWF